MKKHSILKNDGYDDLREKLRAFMGERDLSLAKVAILLDRQPLTIWMFLQGKTSPHDQTLYKIKKLVGDGS